MTTPRCQLIDPEVPLYYHLISRCVQQAWLCGKDRSNGVDYSHRKQWLVDRMKHLARSYAVEIQGFAIMSNHFHMVVYYDPTACRQWKDEEVAQRWVDAFPPTKNGKVDTEKKSQLHAQLLASPEQLTVRRAQLGNLSDFMKHLKQPIARRANKESGTTGHFFEQRYHSGAILDDEALLTSMAYVDLNPVRAKIAKCLEDCEHTSIKERLDMTALRREAVEEILAPLASGLASRAPDLRITLADYVEYLNVRIEAELQRGGSEPTYQQVCWYAQVETIRRRQRAYGTAERLKQWAIRRGFKRPGSGFPPDSRAVGSTDGISQLEPAF